MGPIRGLRHSIVPGISNRVFLGSICLLAWAQPVRPVVVSGVSMEPTYPNNSVVLTVPVNRQLRHGDIVIIHNVVGVLVKRVIHLPGETYRQYWAPNRWIDLDPDVHPRHPESKEYRWQTVPEGMVYVLGDNRSQSMDSRIFGCVSLSEIDRVAIGPRARLLSPVDQIGTGKMPL